MTPTTFPATQDQAVAARTTAQVVASTAARLGAKHLFTLMGGTNMHVVHAFSDSGVLLHHFRHENGVVCAADGLARATGEVGWSSVIQGPGLTNAMTALRNAVKGRNPQVLILPDTSGLPQRKNPFEAGIQGLAPDSILAEIGVPVVRASAATAALDTVAAHQQAIRRLSPVALLIPCGVESEPSPSDVDAAVAHVGGSRAPAEPSAAALDAAERALRSARRIVILAGRGASDPETARLLHRLAELSGAHLATSIRGVGAFSDSPADLGIFGGFTYDAGKSTIDDADCLVSFGASLNYLQTRSSTFVTGKVVVQVDDDDLALNRHDLVDVPVHGDVTLVADELVRRLEAHPAEPARTLPTAPPREPFDDVSTPDQLDPRAVVTTLDRLLPAERTVVIDSGHFTMWPIYFMRHSGPDAMLWATDFGAVGCGMGTSMGAAVGRPNRLTALFVGDCGFYMSMGDLDVAVREHIPLLVVCLNDGAAGSELVLADIKGLPTEEAIFGVADLAKAAVGIGASGAVIAELDDIAPALAGWDRTGPLFLDCHITRDVRSPRYREYE